MIPFRSPRLVGDTRLVLLSAGDVDSKWLVSELEKKACLVRGVWVVQSEFLYPEPDKALKDLLIRRARDFPGTASKNPVLHLMSDTEARNLRATRDIVLWCFTQSRYVDMKRIREVLRTGAMSVRPERLDELLRQVARPPNELLPRNEPERGEWEFLYERDSYFIGKYRDAVAAEKANWDKRLRLALTNLRIPDSIDSLRVRLEPHNTQHSSQSPGSSGGGRHRSTSPSRRHHHHRARARTRSMGFGLTEAGVRRNRTVSNSSTSSCGSCLSTASSGEPSDVEMPDALQAASEPTTSAFQIPSSVLHSPLVGAPGRVGGSSKSSSASKRSPFVPAAVASASASGGSLSSSKVISPADIKSEKRSPEEWPSTSRH